MKSRNIEKKIYECLGVNIFRRYVLFTWEKITKLIKLDVGYRIKDGSVDSLIDYKTLSKGFAIGHSLLLLIIIIAGVCSPHDIYWWITNVGLNTYCVMVQRYTHIRINELLEKMECRKQGVCDNEEPFVKEEYPALEQEDTIGQTDTLQLSKEQLEYLKRFYTDQSNIDVQEYDESPEEQGQSRILK